MDPILLDIPDAIATDRLTLRIPRPGDGVALTASLRTSIAELRRWMPWAKDDYAVADGELWCRRVHGEFYTRLAVHFFLYDDDGRHAGNLGAYDFDWTVRSCEIGYWLRTDLVGRGYMTEAIVAVCGMLADAASIRRIELRCDTRNARSAAVARRCGFALDGTLRRDSLDVAGEPRDMHVFSRVFDAADASRPMPT